MAKQNTSIDDLFKHTKEKEDLKISSHNIKFENYMPEAIGDFLSKASKGDFDKKILKEDIEFARKISEIVH